ncbi:MAG: precorrin-8X methylmutase [Lachnospiraceae bacterium]|nr:precorrin-8X methylmutase [Lachnospiraceae bacterium]
MELKSKIECLLPEEIETRSFEIITEELRKRGISLPAEQEMITKRVIHTSADFDYANTMTYSKDAVFIAKELLKNGADIVTDTNMALSGINKKALAKLGGQAHCFMADEDVARIAKKRGVTRAVVSMEKAADIERPVIFAVGNAPTALIQLYEMIQEINWRPAFVIGVPVGFVNVEVAKELIMETEVPYIINRGRKGGSNVAAAICNALLYELTR